MKGLRCLLAAASLVAWPGSAGAATWTTTCADCPPKCRVPAHAVFVGADGRVRILMTNALWTRDGATWEMTPLPVTTGGVVGCELDGSGTVHAAVDTGDHFYDSGMGYLRRSGDGWSYEVVDDSGPCTGYTAGWDADIAVESGGTPHLLYPDPCGVGLRHAVLSGGTWSVETVFDTDAVPAISAVVDAAGLVRVAFTDATEAEVRCAWRDASGTWSVETVLTEAASPDIALDPAGVPHIVAIASGNLVHAWRDGGVWQSEIVAAGESGAALVIEGDGTVHAAWVAANGTEIRHGVLDGGVWTVEVAVSDGSGGLLGPSLAVDGGGAVQMAYSTTAMASYHATNEGGSWKTTHLCTRYRPGTGADLERAPSGALSAVSTDAGRGVIRLAGQDACLAWTAEDLDPGGSVVGGASLAVDASGNLHAGVRVSVAGTQEIRYGVRTGGSWTWETVASSSTLDQDPVLVLDSIDRPHLVWDVGAGLSTPSALRHGWRDGLGWQAETIDDYGSYLSAAMDASDTLHVAYRNGYELRHAVLPSGGAWTVEIVGGGTVDTCIGTEATLALDGAGDPAIAYFDCNLPWSPKPILLARWDGSVWRTEEAVADAFSWVPLALAFDGSDVPFIAWSNHITSREGATWTTETFWDAAVDGPDLLFEQPDTPSIAFGWEGRLLIARPETIAENDVDGDGLVDAADMEALVGHLFGVPATNPDVSHDCLVDARDTAVLIGILAP